MALRRSPPPGPGAAPSSKDNGSSKNKQKELERLEERLRDEVDEDFFEDPKTFRTLHRVIDVLGAQLLDSDHASRSSDFQNLHQNNPAYLALRDQQAIVEEAIEHMAVAHCSDLNGSVVAVGRVSRQFGDAVSRVRTLRRQVQEIKENLGSSTNSDGDGGNGLGDGPASAQQVQSSAGKSLRELWLKKLECEAVLSLLRKLEIVREAPSSFDALVQPPSGSCRIGAAVVLLSEALQTMFSDDVAQVQALHKIMEQLMTRKQRAEEIVWDVLGDVIYLRTGNRGSFVGDGVVPPNSPAAAAGGAKGGPGGGGVGGTGVGNDPNSKVRTAGQTLRLSMRHHHADLTRDDDEDDAVAADFVDDDISVFSEDGKESDGKKSTQSGGKRHAVAPLRMLPRSTLEMELDLEADELRCIDEEDAASSTPGRIGGSGGSEFFYPRYSDPVLALKILIEALARLGRLDDVERILNENAETEIRKIAENEQTRTYAKLERIRMRGGMIDAEQDVPAVGETVEDFAMRPFKAHLNNLLVAFGSVMLRLSHLAQLLRHRITSDPNIVTPSYAAPSSALHTLIATANTCMQREIKSFLNACLSESEAGSAPPSGSGSIFGHADSNADVANTSSERGIFSLGIINESSSNGSKKETTTLSLASRATVSQLRGDEFVMNIMFPRTSTVPQVQHALIFRKNLATWTAEYAELKKDLANATNEDTSMPSYNVTSEEGALDFLDNIIQRTLLPMLQDGAVDGTITALEREDAFEPSMDQAIYSRGTTGPDLSDVDMNAACQVLYNSTGPLFLALHRLPRSGDMYSPLVAVLEHAILTFISRVKQRVSFICDGKKADALLEVDEGRKTAFSADVELRRAYTLLLQSYFDDDSVDAPGADLVGGMVPLPAPTVDSKHRSTASTSGGPARDGGGGDSGGALGATDLQAESETFEREISHLLPLLDFTDDSYSRDLVVCTDDELKRAASLAHSLLKVSSLLEARLKDRHGNWQKTVSITRPLREAIKAIRVHGLRMAKFCRVDMLIQTAKRLSKICKSSTLFAKDGVRIPSCVNDLGEYLTSSSDLLREAGGNTIAAYTFSSLEQYIPLFFIQTVRTVAKKKGLRPNMVITMNGVEALDRSGSVLYRDLKGATTFENSFWEEEIAADAFERSASFIATIELDMDELISYYRGNRNEFSEEDYKLMFTMNGPRRKGDVMRYETVRERLDG